MDLSKILAELNAEIERLRQAREILSGAPREQGKRPLKKSAAKKSTASTSAPKKRVLSAEARKAIANAQRRRWSLTKRIGGEGGSGTGDGGYNIK